MTLKNWSTTAANNATVDSINFAENQAPSTVNDSARALMVDVRTWYEGVEWRDWGHTPTRTAATTFTLTGDQRTTYATNRPIRVTDAGNTYYGIVADQTYTANTQITVTLDSGSLTASLSAVALGMLDTGDPVHANAIRGLGTAATHVDTE